MIVSVVIVSFWISSLWGGCNLVARPTEKHVVVIISFHHSVEGSVVYNCHG